MVTTGNGFFSVPRYARQTVPVSSGFAPQEMRSLDLVLLFPWMPVAMLGAVYREPVTLRLSVKIKQAFSHSPSKTIVSMFSSHHC